MKNAQNGGVQSEEDTSSPTDSNIDSKRRKAVGKLVYASPAIAALLFPAKGTATIEPPPPPPGSP